MRDRSGRAGAARGVTGPLSSYLDAPSALGRAIALSYKRKSKRERRSLGGSLGWPCRRAAGKGNERRGFFFAERFDRVRRDFRIGEVKLLQSRKRCQSFERGVAHRRIR